MPCSEGTLRGQAPVKALPDTEDLQGLSFYICKTGIIIGSSSGLSGGPQKICPLRTSEYDLIHNKGLCKCKRTMTWGHDHPGLG